MTDPTTFQPVREGDYQKASYDFRGRFVSYWTQIHEVRKALPGGGDLLEIGPGNQLMTRYLRDQGLAVATLDIDDAHRPDFVGSVHALPMGDAAYDVVCAFQVLEHVPFDLFATALGEMARVARKAVLFSVPDVRWFVELDLGVNSATRRYGTILSFPRLTNRALGPTKPGGHLWELGRPGFPPARVIASIPRGLVLERHYRIPGNPLHHMFVLRKA